MHVKMEFNLPEEAEEFAVASKAQDLYFSLFDLEQWLRGKAKMHTTIDIDAVLNKLYEVMQYNGVDLDMMS